MTVQEKATQSKQHFDAREWKAATLLFVEVRDELATSGKEVVQLGDGTLAVVTGRDKDGNVTKTQPVVELT
jgi:hypothetical protein